MPTVRPDADEAKLVRGSGSGLAHGQQSAIEAGALGARC
jgi:hypothetical protein